MPFPCAPGSAVCGISNSCLADLSVYGANARIYGQIELQLGPPRMYTTHNGKHPRQGNNSHSPAAAPPFGHGPIDRRYFTVSGLTSLFAHRRLASSIADPQAFRSRSLAVPYMDRRVFRQFIGLSVFRQPGHTCNRCIACGPLIYSECAARALVACALTRDTGVTKHCKLPHTNGKWLIAIVSKKVANTMQWLAMPMI